MIKRCGLIGIVISLCLFVLFFFGDQDVNYNRNIQTYREPIPDDFIRPNVTRGIKEIIDQEKFFIDQDIDNYPFPSGMSLKDFTLSSGGTPLRNVIIATWRSGSTFLGDVINALPGNFYHYEPLLDYGIMQVRGPPYADSALNNLKKLLICDYKDMNNYLDYGQTHDYLFTHNTRLWNQCEMHPRYCWDENFLSEFCKIFPFQSMKVVRLRLRLAEELLRDKSLKVHVLLLIRDPRGILQSRKHREWCPGVPDCDQPKVICADMISDYSAALKLQKTYPTRFRVIRYEDLSLDPYNVVKDLFGFFRLYFHPNVKRFLDSHTKLNAGGVSSTVRDSKNAPFHWRSDLNYSEVQYIEEHCDQAMKLWGYVRAQNESSMREFNPLTSYLLNDDFGYD